MKKWIIYLILVYIGSVGLFFWSSTPWSPIPYLNLFSGALISWLTIVIPILLLVGLVRYLSNRIEGRKDTSA